MDKFSNFDIENLIGTGSFASVYKAKNTATGLTAAIKIIPKSNITTNRQLINVQREISLVKELDHPFISNMFYDFEDSNNIYLVMEYSENGEIRDYIADRGCLSEEEALKFFVQLYSVIEYLHKEKKIIHRDIKAENVLLDRNNNIKLIDFGLSRAFEKDDEKFTSQCGSYHYLSPEMINGEKYTCESEVWNMGVLLYIMCTGMYPFEGKTMNQTMRLILTKEPSYPIWLSPALVHLLSAMLCKDQNKRIRLEDIKKHQWFSMTQYKNYENYRRCYNKFDANVREQMTTLNIPTDNLRKNLLTGVIDIDTCLYKLLKSEKNQNEFHRFPHVTYSKSETNLIMQNTSYSSSDSKHGTHTHHRRHRAKSDESDEKTPSRFIKPTVGRHSHSRSLRSHSPLE